MTHTSIGPNRTPKYAPRAGGWITGEEVPPRKAQVVQVSAAASHEL